MGTGRGGKLGPFAIDSRWVGQDLMDILRHFIIILWVLGSHSKI